MGNQRRACFVLKHDDAECVLVKKEANVKSEKDVLTSTAKSIGTTLGKLAVKIGVATPPAEAPAGARSTAKRPRAKKNAPVKKAAVKKAVKKVTVKKKALKKTSKNQSRRV